ncbi:hypothetical protein THII_0897 [Thioploca ingrica]|uniref:HicB-like antitoxin of toxin-antitoxin system domain-containing protein n=1 Tax=Thioploca ingrica TaxID=40754 RepID=A0A090AE49_9GAMM|nr:hypothetical protein THII_0897 [Thioploca ingrica]
MNRKVSIVIEKDEWGYYAYCPELPGCQSQGETFEEINLNIKEAVELYLETLSPEEIKSYLSQEIYTITMEKVISVWLSPFILEKPYIPKLLNKY